jgi:thiamine-monophosphate kinase
MQQGAPIPADPADGAAPADPAHGEPTLGSLGEFGLIKALSGWLAADPASGPGVAASGRVLVGIGDDAAVLATPDGRVVATTDFVLEGRHFRREWSTGADVGHKAAARSLADVAAMGAVPTGLLVALAVPADLPVSWAADLAAGLAAQSARAGASVIGGDTARADSIVLAVTGLGDLGGRPPVLRSGARPGDVVAIAGPLGHAAAGLALLSSGTSTVGVTDKAGEASGAGVLARLVAAQLRPAPPYEAGPEAASLGATAMIDVSDGLLADLGHIASASGVLINIRAAALSGDEDLLAAARALAGAESARASRLALEWALTGGEDHSLLATFPSHSRLPSGWTAIGEVRPGLGVHVDARPWSTTTGWDHFRSPTSAGAAG